MKLIKLLMLLALCASSAFAQYTTVSATITDSNSVPYSFARVQVNFVNTSSAPQGVVFTGTNVAPDMTTKTATTDSTGAFSIRLADNSQLSPAGTQWKFSVCVGGLVSTVAASSNQPLTPSSLFSSSSTCFTSTQTISGTSQSLTAALSAASSPLLTFSSPTVKVTQALIFPDGTKQTTAGGGGSITGLSSDGTTLTFTGTGGLSMPNVTSPWNMSSVTNASPVIGDIWRNGNDFFQSRVTGASYYKPGITTSSGGCQALTNGYTGDLCYDTLNAVMYVCVPSAGACDTAGEWKLAGSSSAGGIPDPVTTEYLHEGWCGGNGSTGQYGTYGWRAGVFGGGSVGYDNKPGGVTSGAGIGGCGISIRQTTASIGAGGTLYLAGVDGSGPVQLGGGSWYMQSAIMVVNTTDVAVRWGLGSSANTTDPATSTNAIFIRQVDGTDTQWTCEAIKAGVTTATPIGVNTVGGTYVKAKIAYDNSTGNATCSINGTSVTIVAANMPAATTVLFPLYTVKQVTTTASITFQNRYFDFVWSGLSR